MKRLAVMLLLGSGIFTWAQSAETARQSQEKLRDDLARAEVRKLGEEAQRQIQRLELEPASQAQQLSMQAQLKALAPSPEDRMRQEALERDIRAFLLSPEVLAQRQLLRQDIDQAEVTSEARKQKDQLERDIKNLPGSR